jgi:hypothetical protein
VRSNSDGGKHVTDDPDEMLDTARAAILVGLTPSTLQAKRTYGGGPVYVKLGRKVAYKRSDLKVWLDARRMATTSERAEPEPV